MINPVAGEQEGHRSRVSGAWIELGLGNGLRTGHPKLPGRRGSRQCERTEAAKTKNDNEMLVFVGHQQQTGRSVDVRQRIIWQLFLEHANREGREVKAKDPNRLFSDAQRLEVYRKDKGMCRECLHEGQSEKDAWVAWSEYDADHIVPHALGGETSIHNAQVLCRTHNRIKGVMAK